MKIQIDGTNTVNKGAELMLYAVLQQIEKAHSNAEVIYNDLQGHAKNIHTHLNFHKRSGAYLAEFLNQLRCSAILKQINVFPAFLSTKHCVSGVDVVLDAGGFQFSDQWTFYDGLLKLWQNYYAQLKKQGTKIILLPQAFGPFKLAQSKKVTEFLNQYADVLMPRDALSYQYLEEAGVDKSKLFLYPDFTSLVKGEFPEKYKHLEGGVCLVPNFRMINKGGLSSADYFKFMGALVEEIRTMGLRPFLLNHEGKNDRALCYKIRQMLSKPIDIVGDANALEVKGVIANSYMVFSSRFHGVVSAMNSGRPCLATSWSHKYEALFKEYDQKDCVVDPRNIEGSIQKVKEFLDPKVNQEIREKLLESKNLVSQKNEQMWEHVWTILKNEGR